MYAKLPPVLIQANTLFIVEYAAAGVIITSYRPISGAALNPFNKHVISIFCLVNDAVDISRACIGIENASSDLIPQI